MSVYDPISLIKQSAENGGVVSQAFMENAKTEPNHYIATVSDLRLDIAPIESTTSIEIQPTSNSYGTYSKPNKLTYDMPTTGNLLNLFLCILTDKTPFLNATTATLSQNPYRVISNIEHESSSTVVWSTTDMENAMEYIESSSDKKALINTMNGGILDGTTVPDLTQNDYLILLPLKLMRYNDSKEASQCLDAYRVAGKYSIRGKFNPNDLFFTTGTVTNDSPFQKIFLIAQLATVDDAQTREIVLDRFAHPMPIKDFIIDTNVFTATAAENKLTLSLNSLKNQNIQRITFMLIKEDDYNSATGAWNFIDLINHPNVTTPFISAFSINESSKKIVDYTIDPIYSMLEKYRIASEFNVARNTMLYDIYLSDDDPSDDTITTFLQTDSFRNFQAKIELVNLDINTEYRWFTIATTVKASMFDEYGKVQITN